MCSTYIKFENIFLFILLYAVDTSGFLKREYENGYSNCSTDENLPVVFRGIYLYQFRESQKLFNGITDDYFLCNLGDDSSCDFWWVTKHWNIANSIENGMTEVLSDERWQALEVLQLEDKYINGTIKYTKLVSVDKESFEVPLSWSISENTTLLFCSGEVVEISFCLNVMFSDKVITFHPVGMMEKKRILNITNWADDKWRSFLWSSENGKVKLKKYKEMDEINVLTHRVHPFLRDITLRHLFGHSTGSRDFVKIHNYNYLQSKVAGFHQIGRPFLMKRGRTCITMYVSMCKTCKMIFMMSGVDVAEVEFAEEGTWRNIRIRISDSMNRYEQLYVRTIGNEFANKEKNYWAIDFVSLCSAEKFITIKGDYECENPIPKVQVELKEYSKSLIRAFFRNSGRDFFRILSFVNGTIKFIFKNERMMKDEIKWVSARCFRDYFRQSRPEGAMIPLKRCILWSDYLCGSFELSKYNKSNNNSSPFQPLHISCTLAFLSRDRNSSNSNVVYFTLEDNFQKYKVPEPPVDLKIRDYKFDGFLINWSHPFVGAENLLGFCIEMIKASHEQDRLRKRSFNMPISKFHREYFFIMEKYGLESCTEYFVQVTAIGRSGPGFAATDIVTTPPYLPSVKIKMETKSLNASLLANSTESLKKCTDKFDDFSHFLLILLPKKASNHSDTTEEEKLKDFINIRIPELYDISGIILIQQTTKKSPLETLFGFVRRVDLKNISINYILFNYTKYSEEMKPPIVIEVVIYQKKVNYFLHTFKPLASANDDFLFGVIIWSFIIGNFLSCCLCCCWCKKRRRRMKKNMVKSDRRPTTIENIYFLGDKVKLLDKSHFESINKVQEESVQNAVSFEMKKQNSVPSSDSKKVFIADFEKFLKISIANKELNSHFDALPTNPTKSCYIGQLECNKPKNRFKNIIPYDDTRVQLQTIRNREGSDYINASYIMGYKGKKSYIATQGPKSLTINDFWQMIWQENVRNIIMLVNLVESGVKKVEKYWPNFNEDFEFGKVHVFHLHTESLPDYEIRCFRLVCEGKERKVYQYHFLNWPDNGVPMPYQSLVCFIRKTLEISSKSPIVVHCCSGTSATGVFILCHICVQTAHQEGTIDVFEVARQLREQRVNMIYDFIQYKLAHFLILECLGGPQVVISCNDNIDALVAKLIEPEKLKLQMDYLEEVSWQYRALFEDSNYDQIFVVYPEKNKVKDIHPDAMGSLELERYPEKDLSSCYINAIRVDGYRFSQRYIVTQQPMPNTLNDFWRMIVIYEVEVIVSLNEINLKDKKSCSIWPTEANSLISPVDFIIIKHHSTTEKENFNVIEVFLMVQEAKKKSLKVTIVELKDWKPKSFLPESIQSFLKYCGFVDSITRQLKNTVVTCYDGCTASGLYVATSYLVEMIKVQKNFDVCNTVKTIRRDRKQFITGEKQLAFLYEIAATYIKGYQDYANFGATNQVAYNIYDYIE